MQMAKVGRFRRLLKKATGAKNKRLRQMKQAALQMGWPGERIQDPICAKVREQSSICAWKMVPSKNIIFEHKKIQMIKWMQYTKKNMVRLSPQDQQRGDAATLNELPSIQADSSSDLSGLSSGSGSSSLSEKLVRVANQIRELQISEEKQPAVVEVPEQTGNPKRSMAKILQNGLKPKIAKPAGTVDPKAHKDADECSGQPGIPDYAPWLWPVFSTSLVVY